MNFAKTGAFVAATMLALGCSTALAAGPSLSISSPTSGVFLANAAPAFAGISTDPLDTVDVHVYEGPGVGGTPLRTIRAVPLAPGGEWLASGEEALPDGTYTAEAEQVDLGEASVSEAISFVVDTTPPKVSIQPLAAYVDSSKPTLHGEAGTAPGDRGGVLVRVYQGTQATGTPLYSESVGASGASWSYAPTLPDGTYTAQASQLDEAGNEGISARTTFTVDTVAPTVAIEAPPAYVNKHTLTVTGQLGQATGDVAQVAVTVYKGASASGTVAATGSATVNGAAWSYTTPSLPEGTYTVRAAQHDEAGNDGLSTADQFVVDLIAPVVSVTSPVKDEQLHVSRTTFAGLAGKLAGDIDEVKLNVYGSPMQQGEKPLQTLEEPVVSGSWSTGDSGPALPNGIYTLVVEQEDQAGNVGHSTAISFSVDSSSPTVTLALGSHAEREAQIVTGPSPSFSGTGSTGGEDAGGVVLDLYEGSSTSTASLLRSVAAPLSGSTWSASLGEALPDGVYTVQAEQAGPSGQKPGVSQSVTFLVDADPPLATLTAPVASSTIVGDTVTASGMAGTAPGDSASVTLQVFRGEGASGEPLRTVTVAGTDGAWSESVALPGPGTYTARALQEDDVGNVGVSDASTFAIVEAPPAPAPPAPSASFNWFPAYPHVGEAVSLVSTSTDPASAIVGYAWGLSGLGGMQPGAQTISTTFASPGQHVVALTVADANGVTATATESVPVGEVPVMLMQPFPVVRIAGSESAHGIAIKLLSVLAPVGARVTVQCRGKGCPAKTLSALASSSHSRDAATVLIAFKRFERRLPPGLTIEIKVSKAGVVGKFTRFVDRRGKLPTRQDSCLSLAGEPIECPST